MVKNLGSIRSLAELTGSMDSSAEEFATHYMGEDVVAIG